MEENTIDISAVTEEVATVKDDAGLFELSEKVTANSDEIVALKNDISTLKNFTLIELGGLAILGAFSAWTVWKKTKASKDDSKSKEK